MTDPEQPKPLSDRQAYDRLYDVADQLASDAQLCESKGAATALTSAAEALHIIARGLLAVMAAARRRNDEGRQG